MKKCFIVLAAFLMTAGTSIFAQNAAQNAANAIAEAKPDEKKAKESLWKDDAVASVGFTNTQLTNWAAGGYNTLTLLASLDGNANYADGPMYWNNHLQLDYGFIRSADKPVTQKNNDRIYFESKWGYKATEKLNYTAKYNFRSQFSNNYDYKNPTVTDPSRKDWLDSRVLKSGFLAPAYTDIGFGIDWVPSKWLVVNFAPVTGGFTIVRDELLRAQYKMPLAEDGVTYKPAKFEFGAKLTTDMKFTINEVFNYKTQLVLFSNYLDNPQNLRVNWDNQIDWQIAKHFAVTFKTYLIYDENILIEGVPKTQFKEYLMINYTYKFKPFHR